MPDLENAFLEGAGWGADLNFKTNGHFDMEPPKPSSNLKKLTTATAMLGLLYSMGHFTRPLLKATATQHKPWLLRVIDWALGRFKAVIEPGANYVQHHLSKGALHAQPELAGTLHWAAEEARELYTDVATLAHTTALGFERVVHHTIPVKVHHELVPIRHQQRKLRVGLITTQHNLEQMRRFQNENVPRHGKQRMNKLEHRVYHHDEPILGRTTNLAKKAHTEAHRARHDAHRSQWTWAFAGAVPAFLFAMRRLKLQPLLCRNTKNFTQEVCAMPNGWGRLGGRLLRELIGDLMSFLGVISVVTVAIEVYELLTTRIPGLNESALHYIKHGISEVAGLTASDYLGAVDAPLNLRAHDYLA